MDALGGEHVRGSGLRWWQRNEIRTSPNV
jgi:hypothetical protein